jgi:hypothetical protein
VVKISLWPARQLLDRALRIRAFTDVLQIGGLDLVAERLHHRLAADLVLVGPAEVADRSEIDESDFQLALGGGVHNARAGQEHRRRGGNHDPLHGELQVPDGRNDHPGLRRRPRASRD